jgi:hypothetical protein
MLNCSIATFGKSCDLGLGSKRRRAILAVLPVACRFANCLAGKQFRQLAKSLKRAS